MGVTATDAWQRGVTCGREVEAFTAKSFVTVAFGQE
jgi:hypothetical protein